MKPMLLPTLDRSLDQYTVKLEPGYTVLPSEVEVFDAVCCVLQGLSHLHRAQPALVHR